MTFFEIEEVNFFPQKYHFQKKKKTNDFLFFCQVKHHFLFSATTKQILEIVWGRCKTCSHPFAEIRLIKGFEPFEIIKIYSYDEEGIWGGFELAGCVVFQDHLKKHL
jgi:hypothetical protein